MAKLFEPIIFKNTTLKNRIVMSPMCMYSATNKDGQVTPFHHMHYASRAIGQVGLIMIEATAVQPRGRISERDLGIWTDAHIDGLAALNEQLHQYGAKTAIQLAHAGRKAGIAGATHAPSALPFDATAKVPQEMTRAEIKTTIDAFKQAAVRSRAAGFDVIEIHAAHGYLINQFLSPLTNQRTDEYGGSREARYLFLKEIITAIHSVWAGPVFVRISADEYNEKGNTLADIIYFAKEMKAQGIDLIDVSTGGVVPAEINTYPCYQVTHCQTVRETAKIPTGAVGLITTGLQAEEILQNQRADLIFIGRALLDHPYWAKVAAHELHTQLTRPKQYERGWQ